MHAVILRLVNLLQAIPSLTTILATVDALKLLLGGQFPSVIFNYLLFNFLLAAIGSDLSSLLRQLQEGKWVLCLLS